MWRSSRGMSQVCSAAITGCSQLTAGWAAPCRALTCRHLRNWLKSDEKPKLAQRRRAQAMIASCELGAGAQATIASCELGT